MVNDMMKFYLGRFGTEMAVRRECVRVVVGVVVMDDVVVGGWFSKMRQIVSTVECTMFINTQGTFGK
jgi:hypothetical protein